MTTDWSSLRSLRRERRLQPRPGAPAVWEQMSNAIIEARLEASRRPATDAGAVRRETDAANRLSLK